MLDFPSRPPTRSVPAASRGHKLLRAATLPFVFSASISFWNPCLWAIRTQTCSAASSSGAVRGPVLRSSEVEPQLCTNRRQRAVIRNNFSISPYLPGSRTSPVACVTTETSRAVWSDRSSSGGAMELRFDGPRFWGQVSVGPASHLGPCHQQLFFASPFKDAPRLSTSAGLLFPGQCLQHVGSTNCCISSTRLRTNGFH
ncbi:hypothetical protein T10_7206 [Trichinella papuae]|uniref:Uncharacterized protein n=1 Tax=Trichinella papuae TaxID=268474 RepID=A0A0V1MFE2_9BILA|nr:hypothetical protein T10_7206 [Trichinella papuae]